MDRYLMLGLSVVTIMMTLAVFTDEDSKDYEFSGIIHDVKETSSGFVCFIDIYDGTSFKCFTNQEPMDLGYYAIDGSFSSDRNIYFIKASHLLGPSEKI